MKSVGLYGNSYSDTICYLDNYPEENKTNDMSFVESKQGGIHNVRRGLDICSSDITVNLQPMMLSQAIILFNKDKSTRTSLVKNLEDGEIECNVIEADWHHICYIDNLTKITEQNIKDMKKTGKVSVDFCVGLSDDNLSLLKNVDYIFGSKENFTKTDTDKIMDLNPDVKIMLHDKQGTDLYGKSPRYVVEYKDVVENINPLGAGDYYASCFIIQTLENQNISDTILASHKFATMMLTEEMVLI